MDTNNHGQPRANKKETLSAKDKAMELGWKGNNGEIAMENEKWQDRQ